MDTEALRTRLAAAVEKDDGAATVENFLVGGASLEDGVLSRIEFTGELARRVVDDVRGHVAQLAGRQFVPYDPTYQTSRSQVLVEQVAEIPELARLDEDVREGRSHQRGDDDPVAAMVHAVEPLGAVAYRVKGEGIVTKRRRGSLVLSLQGDVYGEVEGDLLYYEPRFDVVTVDGLALFTNASVIQRVLKADTKAREMARETLGTVAAQVTIAGFDELEQAVMDDPTMRGRMASIARQLERDPEYKQILTTENLVGFAQRNPDFGIPLVEKDGATVLKFEPAPQTRHKILHLLQDGFLRSDLSQRAYEVGSKHRVDDQG